jgi:hypothetical protein
VDHNALEGRIGVAGVEASGRGLPSLAIGERTIVELKVLLRSAVKYSVNNSNTFQRMQHATRTQSSHLPS